MSFNASMKSAIFGLYDLDPIDQRIISYLRQNGRESFAKIADEIGIPASTVRDRTNRMIESGVIKVIALVNPMKTKSQVTASVGVRLGGGNHRLVAEEIAKMEDVTHLAICAGRYDLLVELAGKDNAHLLNIISRIQAVPQVQHTETLVHFSTVKEKPNTAGTFDQSPSG